MVKGPFELRPLRPTTSRVAATTTSTAAARAAAASAAREPLAAPPSPPPPAGPEEKFGNTSSPSAFTSLARSSPLSFGSLSSTNPTGQRIRELYSNKSLPAEESARRASPPAGSHFVFSETRAAAAGAGQAEEEAGASRSSVPSESFPAPDGGSETDSETPQSTCDESNETSAAGSRSWSSGTGMTSIGGGSVDRAFFVPPSFPSPIPPPPHSPRTSSRISPVS